MIEEKNDLMRDVTSSDTSNLRKYLILGGGVFVLFVIGIVVAKFMFGGDNKQNNTAVILPPDMKPAQKIEKKDDTALFNDIPIENNQNNNDEFKKPNVDGDRENLNNQPKTTPSQQVETKQVVSSNQNLNTNQDKTKIQSTKQIAPTENTNKKVVNKNSQPKQQVEQSQTSAPTPPKKKYHKVARYYYIQVAALTKDNPSKQFLKLLQKNGYKYKIIEVNVKGIKVKRVLLGGYTYQEAKKILPKVRKNIKADAFIKRLK